MTEIELEIERLSKKVKKEVSQFELESFAGYLTYFIKHRPDGLDDHPLNKFRSKLKDWLYLIALNALAEKRGEEILGLENVDLISGWADDLNKIKDLYQQQSLGDIDNVADLTNRFIHQASFQTFFDNGSLSYMEQDIDRLKRVFTRFDKTIEKLFGVTVDIIVRWIRYAEEVSQRKFREVNSYQGTKEFQELILNIDDNKTFEQKLESLPDSVRDAFDKFHECTHAEFKFRKEEFYAQFAEKTTVRLLGMVAMFPNPDPKFLFYAQANPIEQAPIMILPTGELLHVYQKQLPIAFSSFLYRLLLNEPGIADKLRKHRDQVLEVKTIEVFKKLFGQAKEAFFYTNYRVEHNTEQDILILYKDTALIIEVKASKFREPFRNPEKGFERIRTDFKDAIQYGYDQCLRVEDKFFSDDQFDVIENDKVIHTVNPKRFNHIFSIIVTLERWGPVQTDLNLLLKKEPEEDFPWSVYIDDLETFVLALKKQFNNPVANFTEFLRHRRRIHGRMYATDEMDICGTYISNKNLYLKMAANNGASMTFSPENQGVFDELYYTGLGFEDEFFIDIKRKRRPIKKDRIKGYVINAKK
ncbi:hypothetical protein [Mucilaginibacter sp.]|uniref:hypothetical protein n=1 Tax=Mucilaginibacter sp. TaxID=1882438 RepID=UPI0025DC1DA8|nr:hypothetical protein [Mucilaginibacter sp.]